MPTHLGIITLYHSKGNDRVKDEKDAWRSFTESGSVMDYLAYKEIQHRHDGEQQEGKDEVQNQGSDHKTAEYR